MWKASNRYTDNFELLYWKADIETYTKFEREYEASSFHRNFTFPEIAAAFESVGRPLRFIIFHMDVAETVSSVALPANLEITSEIVESALKDAELLHNSTGAANALDRVHTALQGYLRAVCQRENIDVKEDADITTLFARIRDKHKALKIADPQAQRMQLQILKGMAQVIDALNPVRNDKSLAHANDDLLDEPEAMLAINSIRTLFHYFDKRLK